MTHEEKVFCADCSNYDMLGDCREIEKHKHIVYDKITGVGKLEYDKEWVQHLLCTCERLNKNNSCKYYSAGWQKPFRTFLKKIGAL